MAQTDRNRKQMVTKGDDSKLQVSDMMERYYVTKKIGFVRHLYSLIFMPPTSKKLRRHIGLGLTVRPSVYLCVTLALGQEPLEI